MDITTFFDAERVGVILLSMLGMIVTLMIKDVLADSIVGIRIYLSRAFEPGDWVYVDGKLALIIAQDFRKTIFQIQDERGTTWRYVINTKFANLCLEKIVTDTVTVNQ
jgi:small-conductance mechanosensitive channel